LDRDQALVEHDVATGVLTPQDAAGVYGVVVADPTESPACRAKIRKDRLHEADPPAEPDGRVLASGQHGAPLSPGVEQRGNLAVSIGSGAVLATAPRHWTDGCPVLTRKIDGAAGISTHAYLDPVTGSQLFVEVAPDGATRSFASLPNRWVDAG
jgi:N-methylhydantoinase B